MSVLRGSRPVNILLVEDNAGDARLTIEAFKEANVACQMNVVQDGVEAIRYLNREGSYAGTSRPDLIMLDLNLPKKNGRDVLSVIKQDHSLRRIPVLVFTTSDADDDLFRSYDLHANCFINKPVDIDEFVDVVKAIDAFWLKVVNLPTE